MKFIMHAVLANQMEITIHLHAHIDEMKQKQRKK